MANGVQASYVDVDCDTGFIRILGQWAVDDCGRVINPLLVDEQVRGGIGQGIGAVLFEECVYSEDANLLNGTMADYLVPMANEMPDIVVAMSRRRKPRPARRQGHRRSRPDRRHGIGVGGGQRRAEAARRQGPAPAVHARKSSGCLARARDARQAARGLSGWSYECWMAAAGATSGDAEIDVANVWSGKEVARAAMQRHATGFHHISVVRDFERRGHVLLDQQHG